QKASSTVPTAGTASRFTRSCRAVRCAAAVRGSRRNGTPSRGTASSPDLKTEHVLNLVPQREDQHDCEPDEDDARDEEAEARTCLFAPVLDARAAPCPMKAVGMLDRHRIDGRLVGCRRRAARGLGHPRDSKGGLARTPPLDHTSSGSGDGYASGTDGAHLARRARGG